MKLSKLRLHDRLLSQSSVSGGGNCVYKAVREAFAEINIF